jgi:hypothetical protein
MSDYYTHREYLKSELDRLPQDKSCVILELGIGEGSSYLINQHCIKNKNHKAMAFETDESWHNQIRSKYELENYIFTKIEDWLNFNVIFSNPTYYDLVFVDQSPWEARIDSINFLKQFTKTFILHDYDYFNKSESCNNIYINDETSWLNKAYSSDFFLEDNYTILPPTLIMRSRTK